jgi:hypothetical protein
LLTLGEANLLMDWPMAAWRWPEPQVLEMPGSDAPSSTARLGEV